MRHLVIAAAAAALVTTAGVSVARAQESNFALVDSDVARRFSGWTFTPSLVYQGAFDDNALLVFGPDAPSDFQSLVNPRAQVTYLGRRSEFGADYDGGFELYRDLNSLNSYNQHASVSGRRLLTPHIAIWARNAFASVPTTELLNFFAVPFIRTGSSLDDLRGGLDVALTKFTSMTVSYNFEWVKFDPTQPFGALLEGGHSHGGAATVKHQLSPSLSVTGEYTLQHATLVNGGTFDVQNADAGVEYKLLPETTVSGAFGVSRLGATELGDARLGPLWHAAINHRMRDVMIAGSYSRSYVPAFGFGGTFQNEELMGTAKAPLARRVYVQTSVAWRRNEPLAVGGLRLKSTWFEATVGYAVQPWVHLEGFFSDANQAIDRAGGQIGHTRVGFQVVTSKPMRIR